jgi:hypothetical protein
MKNLLILLFIPIVCLSQNDFRKMNWGESSEILKEKYSEINLIKEDFMGSKAFAHEDIILEWKGFGRHYSKLISKRSPFLKR